MKRPEYLGLIILIGLALGSTPALATGDCSDYTDLSGLELPITVTGTTSGATGDYGPFAEQPACWQGTWDQYSANSSDVTFKWTAPSDGRFTITLAGSSDYAELLVYDFTCPSEPLYPEEFLCGSHLGALDGARLALELAAGQKILIVVDGWLIWNGDFTLSIYDAATLGYIEEFTFESVSLDGAIRNAAAYLPGVYDPQGDEQYSVVYFLHGAGASYPAYWEQVGIRESLDEMIAADEIEPLIFVMVDGLVEPYWGSYWTNSLLYGDFEDYVFLDLVAVVDDRYRTIREREKRGLQGVSMGGYGAMKIGLKHPEIFRALASHSGVVDLQVAVTVQRDSVLAEYPGGPPYEYYWGAGLFSKLFFSRSGGFSPNLSNPTLVDFPLDMNGDIDISVMDVWELNNPTYLASLLPPPPWPPETNLAIFFDCGTQDEHMEYPVNLAMADSLDFLGIPYEFRSFVGGHSDRFDERFRVGLAFLDSVLRGPDIVAVGDELDDPDPHDTMPSPVGDFNVHPNPFNPRTTIRFEIPDRERVTLTIYDLRGRLIATLLDEEVDAGWHDVVWNGRDGVGRDVPGGVYLSRLGVGSRVAHGRMTLVR